MCPLSRVLLLLAAWSTVSVPSPISLLESRYASAHTLQVTFLERYSENGRFVRAESGIAYFLRPGKMRWDYQSPEKNTFLVDGHYVWFYSPADRTATRMPAKQSEDWRTPLALLTSHMKLSRLCASIEQQPSSAAAQVGDLVFRCDLRDGSASSDPNARNAKPANTTPSHHPHPVLLEVSPDGELRRIMVREEGGRQIEFSFTGWLWNPPLPKSTFEFTAPHRMTQ